MSIAGSSEDVVITEAQQRRRIDRVPPGKTAVDINADAGALQVRRVLDGLIAAESGA